MRYREHLIKLDTICEMNIWSKDSIEELNLNTLIARSDREITKEEADELYKLIEEVRKAYCKLGNKTFEMLKKYREGGNEETTETEDDEYI